MWPVLSALPETMRDRANSLLSYCSVSYLLLFYCSILCRLYLPFPQSSSLNGFNRRDPKRKSPSFQCSDLLPNWRVFQVPPSILGNQHPNCPKQFLIMHAFGGGLFCYKIRGFSCYSLWFFSSFFWFVGFCIWMFPDGDVGWKPSYMKIVRCVFCSWVDDMLLSLDATKWWFGWKPNWRISDSQWGIVWLVGN